jgi:outer membrane lipoprotein SlyB
MTMTLWKVLGASAVALLCAASMQPQQAAIAQGMMQQTQAAPPPVRVRATIEKVNGTTLTVKARDGAEMTVKLADNAPVNEMVKASVADVKSGAYVAVTGMPQPDDSQKALALYIFPEAQRGVAEGHRPWDFAPNSTMTNATVDNQVTSVDGQKLIVKYKDGEQKVLVTPATEITAAVRKSAADLKAGQKILIMAAKKLPDGTLEAPNISFGDYGVWR